MNMNGMWKGYDWTSFCLFIPSVIRYTRRVEFGEY